MALKQEDQLVIVRQMGGGAGGREGTRQGEHHHGPALEDLIASHIDPYVPTTGV
jgi:predicted NAD/FAD-dependent oxidoreductase